MAGPHTGASANSRQEGEISMFDLRNLAWSNLRMGIIQTLLLLYEAMQASYKEFKTWGACDLWIFGPTVMV